jgi:hypothetical protein
LKKRLVHVGAVLALNLTLAVGANATTLASVFGVLSNPNDVNTTTFVYNPLAGSQLSIQTYGYGGTSNAPGGTTLAGLTLGGGGFDPEIFLFSGSGPAATLIASNDNGTCPAGTAVGLLCRDSTLLLNGLAGGTYTLALTAFNNSAIGPTLGVGFTNLGSFGERTAVFAVDVQSIPEPMSSMLLGSGLLAMGYLLRRKRS